MAPRYRITLVPEERQELLGLTRTRKTSSNQFIYARALLLCDRGPDGPAWTVTRTAEALRRQPRQRKLRAPEVRWCLRGSPGRLGLYSGSVRAESLDGPPAGRKGRGTGAGGGGLADDRPARVKKNELQPHRKQYWRIPPEHNAGFVACMEDILAVYSRPCDASRPVLCMDETSKQLIGEVRSKLPVAPGQPERWEHEYVRNGVTRIFLEVEPLAGRRHAEPSPRRTRQDWARWIRGMLEDRYPRADRVVLVADNLNTHAVASLYETYPPAEARNLAERLEIHYTPKHGSWLNIAEIELSVLCGQCLNRRIPDPETIQKEIDAWLHDRNTRHSKVDGHFTTADARIKLKHLYPKL